jgi:hypothetical protein
MKGDIIMEWLAGRIEDELKSLNARARHFEKVEDRRVFAEYFGDNFPWTLGREVDDNVKDDIR